ncbi:type IV secretion system protein [Vibrio cholerae]|uniref:Conjugal transfer protein n=1 Tax=Aeromonas veronii TaxID=654 RepID=A1YBN6_AERVE|nr:MULTISPECIES: type IV secretion system protein [Gammaproteobacteria]ABI83644.1 conjugal transfer protein [Aeromonas veronii]EHW5331729.1 type IV secretion system protein [Escherichia coli]MDV2387317.1 type IV secretion system protein [Vibrio cholerae]
MSAENQEYYEETAKLAEKSQGERSRDNKAYYEAIKSFEQDRISSLEGQRKLLIRGIGAAGGVICLLAVALAGLAPLKTAVPYVIRVDNSTGYTDIAKSISDEKTTYEEVINKYWLSQYVINYESYDWQTVQTMYDTVQLMSDGSVFSEYKNKMLASNSPLSLLKDNYKLKTKVKSVTFLNADTAQVRFTKLVLTKTGQLSTEYAPTDWVALISFDFNHEIKTEGERLLNPLGFNVLSYSVDPEATK